MTEPTSAALQKILTEAERAGARGWCFFEWWLGSVARRRDRQRHLNPETWRAAESAYQRGQQKKGTKAR